MIIEIICFGQSPTQIAKKFVIPNNAISKYSMNLRNQGARP